LVAGTVDVLSIDPAEWPGRSVRRCSTPNRRTDDWDLNHV